MIAFVNNLGEQKGLLLKDRETCIFWFLTMKVIYFNNLNIEIIILNNNLFLNYDIYYLSTEWNADEMNSSSLA
jgi:hypothetical protein